VNPRSPSVPLLLVLGLLLVGGAYEAGTARAGASARFERRRTPVVEAVEHVSHAVVSVDAYFAMGGRWVGRSSGAGVIVNPDGYVVTNSHVVQGTTQVRIELFGRGGAYNAQVVADDPAGDLAVLKIQANRSFPYVSCCPTNELMLGETAIAIGNPHGLGDTITVGVISALGRNAVMSDGAAMRNLVQTDAAINSGNSGGPLINLDGELIGINVSVLPSAKGIAFAIGADQVRALMQRAIGRQAPRNAIADEPDEPIAAAPTPTPTPSQTPAPAAAPPPRVSSTRESPPAPSPNLSGTPDASLPAPSVSTPLRPQDFGLVVRDDGRRIVVTSVPARTPASVAGLETGDIVLTVDGHPVEDQTDLLLAFSASVPGRVYYLEVRRGSEVKRMLLVTPR
jgi:S1-C subfamily serine protease